MMAPGHPICQPQRGKQLDRYLGGWVFTGEQTRVHVVESILLPCPYMRPYDWIDSSLLRILSGVSRSQQVAYIAKDLVGT